MVFLLYRQTTTQTQTAVKKREMTTPISSLVRIWKIRHSGPGYSFVWILRVVYLPVRQYIRAYIIKTILARWRNKMLHSWVKTAVFYVILKTSNEQNVTAKRSQIWDNIGGVYLEKKYATSAVFSSRRGPGMSKCFLMASCLHNLSYN